ncbi:hypothetical protein NMG60_11015979 [Bertholletia excelsa]
MAGQNQGGPHMNQFEAYFLRADLDRDGRISGAEAVAFFQGSNLPKQVLAQIWMHADQGRTGFLGRAEFYNALKLVTVAQSKRELTPDIVKAALYGPASSKIPAPQINLAAIPASQGNSMAATPMPHMGAVAPAGSQNVAFRGQVPQNASMNQQYFPSQGNQSMKPPLTPITGNAPHPSQSVSTSDFSRGTVAGPTLPNSNITNNWLSGRTGGVSPGTSVVPNQGINQQTASPASKPQDPLSSLSSPAVKDSKVSVGSGNGFASDPVFGGDVFSATQSLQKPDSSSYSVTGSSASPAIVPSSAGPSPSNKPDPFELLNSSFTRQAPENQVQHSQSPSKASQQTSAQASSALASSGISARPGNSTSNQSQISWPKMTPAGIQKYTKVFTEVDSDRDGKITGEQARNLFLSWRLPREVLKQVWDLSDQDNDSMLSLREFCIALYLMERYREGRSLPPTLPSNILLDETLLSLTGPPNASFGNAAWGHTAGFRPQQGMPASVPMTSAAGLRPQMPGMFPQGDGATQFNQQKGRVPLMEGSHSNQLSNGEDNSVDTKSLESVETEKKVEDKEKVLLDSKEKLEYYRTKMQDLVLYKSRCENRLNEITERAMADKREAELLGKKYEEKYKQVAETASKLTIEEAAFREVQERKMELHQAIIKMEQGGSADGILQVRADRIQSDLEELIKALTERCKRHGIDVKSTAVIELPVGWQPGIPELSSVWDEDWDKFEDEGFSFDGAIPSKTKSTSIEKGSESPNGSLSPGSLSHADGTLEKPFSKGRHGFDSDSVYTHSEDESGKSPTGSPGGHTALESPSREYSDNHFKKSPEVDDHRSFDESGWGTFDNNDDIDSVWGFNSGTGKNTEHEKHGEKYFFEPSEFGGSPRTDSPQADSMFPKRSPFFEDSVPSTPLSRVGNSPPRYSAGSVFDSSSRFDSFSMHEQAFSPRHETFSRFDSMSSTRGFDHSQGPFSRFDSINSTTGFEHSQGTLTRFDSMNSTSGFDYSNRFSSFDDSDPFGSSAPFKVSSESQTPKKA